MHAAAAHNEWDPAVEADWGFARGTCSSDNFESIQLSLGSSLVDQTLPVSPRRGRARGLFGAYRVYEVCIRVVSRG